MNKHYLGRIYFVLFGAIIVVSLASAYYTFVVKHDYLVKYTTHCDPTVEKCFVEVCDLEVTECTGNEEEDTKYYTTICRKAYNVPDCERGSDPLCEKRWETCAPGEKGCAIKTCEEAQKEDASVECSEIQPKEAPEEAE